jgi:hypothetical protein
VPRVLVPDNLKSAVIRAAFGVVDEPVLNRSYREHRRTPTALGRLRARLAQPTREIGPGGTTRQEHRPGGALVHVAPRLRYAGKARPARNRR